MENGNLENWNSAFITGLFLGIWANNKEEGGTMSTMLIPESKYITQNHLLLASVLIIMFFLFC